MPSVIKVTKPRFSSKAREPATTLKQGEEIRLRVFGRIYTIRAVGNEHIGGQVQIFGRSLHVGAELFAGYGNYVIAGKTIVVGYRSDLQNRNDLTIKNLY